jgi:hypothetical protein
MRTINQTFILLLILCYFQTTAQDANLEAAKFHVQNRLAQLNLTKEEINEMTVSSAYLSPTTGWYHAYFNQTYQGIDVYNGILNVTLKDGHVINIGNSFTPNIAQQLSNLSAVSSISAKDALVNTLKNVGIQVGNINNIQQISTATNLQGNIVKYTFSDAGISNDPIEVKLYWYPYQAKIGEKSIQKIALTWNASLLTKDNQNAWSTHVDANTGEVIAKIDRVIKCEFGHKHTNNKSFEDCQELVFKDASPSQKKALAANSYNVFNYPLESPSHGSRSIVSNPYSMFAPSGTGPGATNGWHHDGTNTFTDTRGNNVYAQEDANADNSGGIRPNPSNYDFDYPYTLGLNTASGNQNAAITNLFFWNNLIHDALWRMGFDEPAGNFQANNMSRGGAGNDFVFADAQDGSGTSNANFFTPIDGSNPRMQMFLWFDPVPYDADSDFDNAIIAHEYGHGWSIRLTGGPNNSSCLTNVEQGGEGWSDYLGLMLTTNWASLTPTVASANIPRGIGTYVLGQATTGLGIRPYRYSYDKANVNPLVTYAAVANTNFSQPHGIGSIWCTMLWDMTWEIILQDNAIDPNVYNTTNMIGNVAALKLVNEGLRLQPCSPSFVQARDAILAADQALFGGRYRCAIGRAFARRGLGANASTGTSSNDRIITEDYTPVSGNALSSPLFANACSGTAFNYTATSNISGTVFSWSRAAVAGISNPAASSGDGIINEILINTTTNPINVTYVFTFTPDGCGQGGSVQQNLTVSVNPPIVNPIVSSYAICQIRTVPTGEGLIMPSSDPSSTVSSSLNSLDPIFSRPPGLTGSYYYKFYTYTAQTTGSVTFEITAGPFDTFLLLYDNSFNPASPSTNLITYDDDSGVGLLSSITYSVVQGNTYVLVVSSFSTLDTGTFTLNASSGGYGSSFSWYTAATGGTPIFTGSLFNPVGVAGSGIPNTISPIVKNYYVARIGNPNCRATTTFTVSPASVSSALSGMLSESDTICAIFNAGTLTLQGYSGTVLGWEVSENNFSTYTTLPATNINYTYSGITQSRKVRAILDRGACQIARSKHATLYVTSPMQTLTGSVEMDTILTRSSLQINSNQVIVDPSKVHYMAGRSVQLNQGFEAKAGTNFKAEIFQNDCFIPATLTLQPNATQGKDTDISSLFVNNTYTNVQYSAPYAWTQFGNNETRRSLIQFDLSSIPANAVIDSAFLSLYYSQKFVTDNPPFTGHFGTNTLEIRRITSAWNANTVTWANQPTSTEFNMVTVPATTSQTQDYPKINVKNLVSDIYTSSNNGFLIKLQTETPYKLVCLTTSEEATATRRPRLIVYYRYR